MRRVQHPSNNDVLAAPGGWRQDALPCNALPITRTEVAGMPCVISFWRPTAEDLVKLNAGALLALFVIGETTPPLGIEICDPEGG